MRFAAWLYVLLRHWTWVRAGWNLGRMRHLIDAQNRRIENAKGTWRCTTEWNGRAWIVTDLQVEYKPTPEGS